MKGINANITISAKDIITIFNILRSIGLNTTHKGTKYINKAIQLLVTSNSDIIVIENIYSDIAKYYNVTPKQVKNAITYALNNRLSKKSIQYFQNIFGFEYDEYYFTNKTIIEELSRVVKYNIIAN